MNRPTGTATGARKWLNETAWHVLAKMPDDAIRECVARSIPHRAGEWRTYLKRLVQGLRHIDPTAPPIAYLHVIEQWHRFMPSGPETPTWQDVRDVLVNLWPDTDPDESDGYMARWCRRHVDTSASHAERVRQSLVALAKLFGRRRYFLGVRTLAKCAGMSKTCAAKHLNRLLARGAIRVERRSGPHIWERLADVIHTGPLFALSDAVPVVTNTNTDTTCLPCVRTPFVSVLPEPELVPNDDLFVMELVTPDATDPGWWDDDASGKAVPVPAGRYYTPIVTRDVPVDF